MSEVTVTIVQKKPPGAGKTMWDLIGDDGNKYKIFPVDAGLFEEKKRYRFTVDPREHNGYAYNVVKGTPKLLEGPQTPPPAPQPLLTPAPATTAEAVGPHVGMWEKEVSGLIERGMNPSDIPDHIATVRVQVQAGLRKPINNTPGVSLEETLDF